MNFTPGSLFASPFVSVIGGTGFLSDLTAGYLIASLFISGIGAFLFIYGKKQERIPHFTAGVVMSVYPFFITGVAWMIIIAVAILAGLTYLVRAGY